MSARVISWISSTHLYPLLAAFLNLVHVYSLAKYRGCRLWAVVSAAHKMTRGSRALELLFFHLTMACTNCVHKPLSPTAPLAKRYRAGCDRVKKKRRKNSKWRFTTIAFNYLLLRVLLLRSKRLQCQETESLALRYFVSVKLLFGLRM